MAHYAFINDNNIVTEVITGIDEDVTDDAMMIELLGGIVEIVEGDAKNIKLTNPIDFQIAINLLDLDFDIGKDRYY